MPHFQSGKQKMSHNNIVYNQNQEEKIKAKKEVMPVFCVDDQYYYGTFFVCRSENGAIISLTDEDFRYLENLYAIHMKNMREKYSN